MLLVGNTGGEIHSAIHQQQAPQAVKLERDIENVFRSADKTAVAGIINIDAAIAEIADPELSISNLESPRCVEISARDQAPKQLPMRVEDVDKTTARAGDIILSIGVLFRIRHHHVAVKIANSERRIPGGNIGITEWKSRCLDNKIFVVRLDVAGMEIGHIKKTVIVSDAHRRAFENRAGGASVARRESVGVVQIRIPARNHSVFADEDELGRKRVCSVANAKGRCVVPDRVRGICAFGISCARRNRNNEWIRETGRGRPVLAVLGRNASAVIDDEYGAPVRACHTPGVYDMGISESGNTVNV